MGMLTAALPSIEAMTLKKRTLSWLAVLFLTGVGILVSPRQVLTRTPEVARALNPVLSSYEVLRFEPGEIERQVRTTGELRLRFDGTDFHFNLKPHSLRAPNYRAVETGPGGVRRTLPPQPVRTFKGTLAGRGDTRGRFNLTGRGIEGVVFAPEGLYYVEPLRNYLPGTVAGDLVVYRQSDIKPSEDFKCGVSLPKRLERAVARVRAQTETDSPTNYVADVATEADYEYVQRVGGTTEANSDIEGILNVIAEVYQNELLVTLRLSFQHAWATAEDPYTATTDEELESEFVAYWSEHFAEEQDFNLAHIWSAKSRVVGGSRNHICTENTSADPNDPRLPNISWGVASYTTLLNLKYTIPAHEMGHNFGATHTIDNHPPLPNCSGTIMNAVGGGWTFCQFSRDEIADHLANYNSCLDTQDITLQPPSDLSATAASSSAINLTWEDNSTDETGYSVQRRRRGGTSWAQIGTTTADTETYSHQGLFSESTYIYRVQAFNDSESSAFSKDADATTLAGPEVTNNWRIHTVAGGNIGDGGMATEALLTRPGKVAVDSSGNLYIAESSNHRIRKVDTSGIITTIAGTGAGGFSGDGGMATEASLNGPSAVAVDSSGNLYIADYNNHRVRKVDTSGIITTIAGTGASGFSGDGGLATAAMLNNPSAVAVDSSGNLYIADPGNRRIRKVDTSGTITSVAATINRLTGLTIDASGNVYFSHLSGHRIRKVDSMGTITIIAGTGESGFSGDGGLATAAMLNNPSAVAVDSSGNLYIADSGNHRIRKVDTSGTITTIAGTGAGGFSGDRGLATAASLNFPISVKLDSSGNLYISDYNNHRVRKVDTSGTITTVAGVGDSRYSGDGGPATAARLNEPSATAVDSSGNLYIADYNNHRVRKVDTSGTITTIAGTGERGFSGDGGLAVAAKLAWPEAVAVDGSGNLYIADTNNNRVRRVDSQGVITTVATGVNSPRGMALDSSGNLYIAERNTHRIRKLDTMGTLTTIAGIREFGFSGDGGPATAARLYVPRDVALDSSGNLYIADTGNHRIRKVDTSGMITTIAGIGPGFDSDGTGPATEAAMSSPTGIAVDSSGNLYIADTYNSRIRKVDTSGTLTTITGNGEEGFSGDGGPADEGQLHLPAGVAEGGSGDLYIADSRNHRIRVLSTDLTTPTVETIAITSNPVRQATYAANQVIRVAVTFSEAVVAAGMPQLAIEVATGQRAAVYESGTGTAALVFAYEVGEQDSDTDGVSIGANPFMLGVGTIRDSGYNDAVLDHGGLAADSRHKVDGIKPVLTEVDGAVVNLGTLTLTYSEPLDGSSPPPPSAFRVLGGDETRTVANVLVSGSTVELTLDAAVDHGETGIQVSYTVPTGEGASPIRDPAGNPAAALARQAVANETPDISPPKVSTVSFSSSSGTDRTYAAGEDIQVTVTFNKEVAVTGSPQMTLNVGGEDRTASYGSVTGAAVTFSYTVADGDSDGDGVSIDANSLSLNGGTIKDSTDDTDAVLNHRAVAANVGHKVDASRPALVVTGGAVVNGSTLTLTYDEPLNGSSTPEATAFTVSGGDQARMVTGVRVSGSKVELTLDPAVEQAETGIRVSYTVPTGMGASPIRDGVGNTALGLSNEPVTNETPDTIAPTVSTVEITSDPGSDRIYVPEDEIQATVTFSEPVDVERTPRLMLKVGDRNRRPGYLEGTGTTELVFAYEVVKGDEDTDGVSIDANSLSPNGGTIKDASNNSAELTHDAVGTQSGHKVDGAGPDLAETGGAAVDGTTLTLTFDETLDGSSTPQASAFRVTGGDTARTVTDVALSGSAVLLTLDPAVEHGETGIRVSYAVPTGADASPLRDGLGNDAGRLSNVPVTNETPDTTPPTVSKVEITSNPGTDRTYAADDEIRVTVTFSETVEVTGSPQLRLEFGGGSRTATYEGGSGTAALVFAYQVADGESDTDGVGVEADSLSGGTIRDEARNNAELDHDGVAANSGHQADGVKPELAATGGAVVSGTTLTLTYDEGLDGRSTPEAGDFTVSGGDQTRTVSRVLFGGTRLLLTLDVGAEHLEAGIQVSYTPGTNPIRDVPGNEAEALSRESVTNETPDTTAPEVSSLAISSNPGSDQIYAAGDEIEVTVTFSETVKVTGRPRLMLRVGSRTRPAHYESGTETAELVFGYEVDERDEDTDGVSIEAGRIALNGGTIRDEVTIPAELAHEALATQTGHKVDGVPAAFVSAAVDGSSLTLTYGEGLDGGSRPASGDFTVEVDGSGRSVTGVSISGSVVTLTLNPPVEHGDTGIQVSYTPGTNPIRDAVGNEARGLSSQSVTNTTGAPNTAPEITSPSSFDVPENQSVARRLAARDTDPGDEVTGWSIVGGADRSEFSIASDTGELSFRDPPDFEAPGDNEYLVTVEVTSGAGARELKAEKTFTISVTDEREPPGVPEAPTFSRETADSLEVSWSEPENRGPAITDYDVQFREKGTGRFTDGGHEGPGLTVTIEDLKPGTVYEVQVRAENDEGTSDWSDAGEGMTVTPLTVGMTSGTDPPVSGPFTVRFSFSEPVTGFSAGDIETGQNPACTDDQNNMVFCDPGIGSLQTTDDRIFTTTVTPGTDRVAHSYTLTLTVPGDRVRSAVGSKPNEEPEEPLEVRVSPPGAPEPISSLGLAASGGDGEVRLSWNRPTDNGGSAIIRYEVRYQAVGEAWSEWENVGAGARGGTVGGLVNGREYVFEVRVVNALGKGGAETVRAVPERRITPPPPPPGGGGGGGGGGLLFPPEAPAGLMAMPGEGAVRLEWGPPESDGGTPILRYEYRLKEGRGEFGEWTPIADSAPGEVNATGYTVGELDNGTVYVFELRGVNLVGEGRVSEAVEAVMGLDRAYWSNFLAGDLQGIEASLERGPFGGGPQSLRLRFGAGLRFEESELDGDGEVRGTRMGGYGYRYTSRTTGELRLDYDGGKTCELRLTFSGEGAGSYSYRCGGVLGGQGSFRLSGLNRGPEITGAGVYEVAENTTRVGQLEAVDGDDEIGGYGIAGGADGALFAVVEETGELMFREAPDYEDPSDVESAEPASGAADNEYIVVVEVRSGEGERERKGSRAIRVRVGDEEEPPGAPGAPVVTAEGSDSLKVSWREPENRGPEIVDYEVRYREGGEAGYSDGGHEGRGLEVRLSGLEEGTAYEVQVRAVNQEGMSEWSEPGEGRTDSEEPDPDDPSDFTGEDLEGRRLTLRLEGEEGSAKSLELWFGEGNRFEQIESGGEQAATRSRGRLPIGQLRL